MRWKIKYKRSCLITLTALLPLALVSCHSPFDINYIYRDASGHLIYSYSINSNSPNYRSAIPNPDLNSEDEIIWDYSIGTVVDGPDIPIPNLNLAPKLKFSAPNKKYRNAFSNTFEIKFLNENLETKKRSAIQATSWILDYRETNDGSYPTTFYLGTNLHVANALIGDENDTRNKTIRTDAVVLTKYVHLQNKDENINKITQIDGNDKNAEYKMYSYTSENVDTEDQFYKKFVKYYDTDKMRQDDQYIDRGFLAKKPRVVYVGTDYLDSSPQIYNRRFAEEEAIDFAVIEVVFKDSETAKRATSDYANEKRFFKADNERQFRRPKQSLLKLADQELPELAKREANYYIAGFPKGVPSINRGVRSNKSRKLYNHLPLIKEKDSDYLNDEWHRIISGAPLANFQPYSTTGRISANGIGDALLILPYFRLSYHDKNYTLQGLTYAFENSGLEGGSSGSAVYDQNGATIAVHSIGNSINDVNLAFSLFSEGLVHPEYKTYQTPAYDLIYGGVKGQKTWYLQSLKNLYKKIPNFSTHLMKSKDFFNQSEDF